MEQLSWPTAMFFSVVVCANIYLLIHFFGNKQQIKTIIQKQSLSDNDIKRIAQEVNKTIRESIKKSARIED